MKNNFYFFLLPLITCSTISLYQYSDDFVLYSVSYNFRISKSSVIVSSLPSSLLYIISQFDNLEFTSSTVQGSFDSQESYSIPQLPGLTVETNSIGHPLFETFANAFSSTFSIAAAHLLDRAGYISFNDKFFYNLPTERPCNDNLGNIKLLLEKDEREEFEKNVNKVEFTKSSFKFIKITLNSKNEITLSIDICHKYNVYRLSTFLTTYPKDNINIFYSKEPNAKHIERFQASAVKSKIANFGIISSRYLIGKEHGFEQFTFVHQIENTSDNSYTLNLAEIFPEEMDIVLSEIEIDYEEYVNGNLRTRYWFNKTNYKQFLSLRFSLNTEANGAFPFSHHENKYTSVFTEFKVEGKTKTKVSFGLRKKIITFESYENNYEFGYFVPGGLVHIKENNSTQQSNYLYFNIPNVDNTWPFNVITLTWIVWAFVLVHFITAIRG